MGKGLTPAMQQYMDIKNEHKDCLVFFRMGDFYETFFDDAVTAAKELEITLTKRGFKGDGQKIPLAGVPYHSIDNYLPKLVRKGYKVAIVEQLEDPKLAKGVVKRGLVRIVTPGTLMEGKSSEENSYVLSVFPEDESFGMAFVDISTGEFTCTEVVGKDDLVSEIVKYGPKEIILPMSYEESRIARKLLLQGLNVDFRTDVDYYIDNADKQIKDHFQVQDSSVFGLKNKELARSASGALLAYVHETQMTALPHINTLKFYSPSEFMSLDRTTVRNLELIKNYNDGSRQGTLLQGLDHTVTPMGRRLLKRFIQQPLIEKQDIVKRLDAVEELVKDDFKRGDLIDELKKTYDIERIISKINYGNANPRDLTALSSSLKILPKIKKLLSDAGSSRLKELREFDDLRDAAELIDKAIKEEPPASTADGNFIAKGYNSELDELKSLTRDAKTYIKNLEKQEKEKTGIRSLKIKFNKVFGYFLEVTKANIDLVPDHYIKKQTLVNAERFITPELKEKESLILGSVEKSIALEQKLFEELKVEIKKSTKKIQQAASDIAHLDVFSNLADIAIHKSYSRPDIREGYNIGIIKGRHPVIEEMTDFVPNDLNISEKNRTMIITGPNMAGKSVFMRQAALITLMAQMGSFVPAEFATISVVDRIFTRVGASDDVSRGQSTFMVEMVETGQILRNATEKSLIILDEIGRGTSTFDGVALAWAIAEHINDNIRAKTLFATHYHVLNELENQKQGIKNYNILVKEEEGKVIFLRKVIEGGTDKSYGVHVAKLAGLPKEVIERSREIQFKLEHEDEIAEKIIVEKKKKLSKDTEEVRMKKTKQKSLNEMFG